MRSVAPLSAVTIAMVTALGVSGCAADGPPVSAPTAPVATAQPSAPAAAPLPTPDALADVLYRLADPSIPAEQKLALVQYATPADQDALGGFARALTDGGFRRLTVEATDLAWASDPGNAMATVRIGTADDANRAFTFPMEFTPLRDGWQLTRTSAEELLVVHGPPTTAPR